MRTGKFGALPSIAVTAVLIAGCAAQAGSTSVSAFNQPESPNIVVAATPAADLAGLYIAQDEGLFARQGLHVTLEKIASNQAAVTAQLKGRVDVSAQSYVSYIAAQAAGARFRILAEASTLRPGTRVLVAPATSHITAIAGLAGQKIGVNGTNNIGTLLVSALLQENDISLAKVGFITDAKGYTDMPGQLQRGSWGAALLAEPYATIAELPYGRIRGHPGVGREVPQDGRGVRPRHRGRPGDRRDQAVGRADGDSEVRRLAVHGDRRHGAARIPYRPGASAEHPAGR
jgi:NitT/TauT family transport system substrate-binding protein